MTKKELLNYRTIKNEIADIDIRLEKLYAKEIPILGGTVKGSTKSFPYTEVRTSVLVESPVEVGRRDNLISELKKKKELLYAEQLRMERFIEGIEDSTNRMIFRLTYFDGLKQREVGDKVGLDRSVISRRIAKYI